MTIEPSAPSSRSVRAAEKPASPPPTIRKSTSRSGTFELRLALLGEGGEALGRVRGLEQAGDALALAGERAGDRHLAAGVGGELDLTDRHCGAAGELGRIVARTVRGLGRGEEAVEDAQAVRLTRADRAPGDHQVQRLGYADDPRQ